MHHGQYATGGSSRGEPAPVPEVEPSGLGESRVKVHRGRLGGIASSARTSSTAPLGGCGDGSGAGVVDEVVRAVG